MLNGVHVSIGSGSGDPKLNVTFESAEAFLKHVTPKRLEMVRFLRENPTASVAELARRLGGITRTSTRTLRRWLRLG